MCAFRECYQSIKKIYRVLHAANSVQCYTLWGNGYVCTHCALQIQRKVHEAIGLLGQTKLREALGTRVNTRTF